MKSKLPKFSPTTKPATHSTRVYKVLEFLSSSSSSSSLLSKVSQSSHTYLLLTRVTSRISTRVLLIMRLPSWKAAWMVVGISLWCGWIDKFDIIICWRRRQPTDQTKPRKTGGSWFKKLKYVRIFVLERNVKLDVGSCPLLPSSRCCLFFSPSIQQGINTPLFL